MSAGDGTDHARGWLFAEGLLLEDKIARLEKLDGKELEEALRAEGVEPARVPGVEELVARAAALAKQGELREGVDHARGWTYVETLMVEDGGARPAVEHEQVPTLDALLAKAGKLAEERASGVLEPGTPKADAKAPEAPRAALAKPRRRLRPVWLVAAVVGAMVCVFAGMNGAAIADLIKGQKIQPGDTWLPWKRGPTPAELAAPTREKAFAACAEKRWDDCAAWLDEAQGIDPAGEDAAQVVAARKAIAEGEKAPLKPKGPKPPR